MKKVFRFMTFISFFAVLVWFSAIECGGVDLLPGAIGSFATLFAGAVFAYLGGLYYGQY